MQPIHYAFILTAVVALFCALTGMSLIRRGNRSWEYAASTFVLSSVTATYLLVNIVQ